MSKFKIVGGNRIEGSVKVCSAKNSILPLICATILTESKVKFLNVEKLYDVLLLLHLLSLDDCSMSDGLRAIHLLSIA